MNVRRYIPALSSLPVALCLSFAGGCLQVETKIAIEPDGGATVTERVQFSQQLLDLGVTNPGFDVAPLLAREAVLDRMKHMGAGLRLVSYEVRPAGGARESLTVFHIDDINELRYASPFLAFTDYASNNLLACKMVPLYKSQNYHGAAGEMAVSFRLLKSPKRQEKPKEGEPEPPGPSPLQLQISRELGPVFRDILKGFRVRLTFESYAPVSTGFGMRGRSENAKFVDLINFTDEDLDSFGGRFLENEEVMLDLVRGEIGSANVCEHIKQFSSNRTVPVFHPWGSRFSWWIQGDLIAFAPSRQLFDRYFVEADGRGKMLDYSRWADSPPDKKVVARFEDIGYRGDKALPATRPQVDQQPPTTRGDKPDAGDRRPRIRTGRGGGRNPNRTTGNRTPATNPDE